MYFWKNGKKVKAQFENFKSLSEESQLRRAPIRESYQHPSVEHYNKKKCPVWLYAVLGGSALVLIVLLVVWFVRSRGEKHQVASSPDLSPSPSATHRFGFRFY